MTRKKYKHIYGPVSSWRLGRSLGIDPVYAGGGKVCSFDCVYCQAGRIRRRSVRRKVFVPTKKIIEEIKSFPPVKVDYVTFSGAGEPTLAKNLGEIIKKVRKIRKQKIAVLTNSFTINKSDVRKDLMLADFVIAKLDAHSQKLFTKINKPAKVVKLKKILTGLKKFKARYKGKFALQIMFVKETKPYAREIAELARWIHPDEVQINTPLRFSGVKPLSRKEIDKVKRFFKGIQCVSVYEKKRKKVLPVDKASIARRRARTV